MKLIGSNSNDLQSAIERSVPGDVLVCPMGSSYGPIQLPARHLGSVTVQCQDFDQKFGMYRTLPSSLGLPEVSSDSISVWPLQSEYGSGGITFQGLKFTSARKDKKDNPSSVVTLGFNSGHLPATNMAQLSRDVCFDRCDIGSIPEGETTQHGLILNAINVSVRGCLVHDIVHGNTESHGIYLDDTPGPIWVEDNNIVASGINLLCGGGSPHIPGQMVCSQGLFVRRNWMYKLESWSGRLTEVGCKNLFELKNCWLARVEMNSFSYCWADNQDGHAILFTPREQNPERPAPLTKLGDIFFGFNRISKVGGGMNISGSDDLGTVSQTERIHILGNSFSQIGSYTNAPGRAFNINGIDPTKPIRELIIQGNMIEFNQDCAKSLITFQGRPHAVRNLLFESNAFGKTRYGVFATGGRQWQNALNDWCQSGSWQNNVCMDDLSVMKSWSK